MSRNEPVSPDEPVTRDEPVTADEPVSRDQPATPSEPVTADDLRDTSPQVLADDLLVERLRAGVPPTGDAGVDDPAARLLTGLLLDVSRDRPVTTEAPLADVVPIVRRRRGARVAAVAACAVGLVSVGGIAAASPGTPLYGVRTAVGHAVTSVARAVDPSSGPHRPVARPLPAATPEARSVQAARLVAALLDRAERDLALARTAPARALLRDAATHLPEVSPADGQALLATRLAVLTARLPVVPVAEPHTPPVPTTPVPVHRRADPHGKRPSGGADRPAPAAGATETPHAHSRVAPPGGSAKAERA